MTQRQLDLTLLGGIGVLLLVILALALSRAPTLPAGDISDPAASVAEPADAEAEPAETVPAAEAPATVQPTPAETATEPAVGEAENEGVFTTDLAAGAAEDTPTAGVTEVERVGFAYATGEGGACGVPLTAWSFVAVSRDLLERYPCGTTLTLTLADEIAGRREVTARVGDTMGAPITNTVNIFVAEDEPALEYGVTQGTLSR